MDESSKKRLSDILNSFEAEHNAAKKEEERKKTEHELFLEDFSNKAKSIIRPSMEQVAEILKARGHNSEITEQKETIDSDGSTRNAGITLSIYPLGERSRYHNKHYYPQIAFMVCHYGNNIYVHESTMMPERGGHSGRAGEYTLDEVTPELVEKHILSVLQQAMEK